MLFAEITNLSKDYANWIQDNIRVDDLSTGYIEITTPFIDRHNDGIQIYARKEGNNYVLTDAGYVLEDLQNSGIKLSEHRRQILGLELAGLNVENIDNQLQTVTNKENFPISFNNLIQGCISANNLSYLSEARVESIFYEDVKKWLIENKIAFESKVRMGGTEYEHEFHFSLRTEKNSKQFVQTISKSEKMLIGGTIWMLGDVRKHLKEKNISADIEMCVILKEDTPAFQKATSVFENAGIAPYFWNQPDVLLKALKT